MQTSIDHTPLIAAADVTLLASEFEAPAPALEAVNPGLEERIENLYGSPG